MQKVKIFCNSWSVDGIVEDAITVKDGLILKGGRIKEVIQTAYEEVTEQDSDRIVQTVASGDVVVLALGEPELYPVKQEADL